MIRVAFRMKLKKGCAAEYKRRHDEIWPEQKQLLKNAGIFDFSIFLDPETETLFAVRKLSDDNTAADLPKHALIRRWWEYMSDLMETNPDKSPVCTRLTEVFHLE